MFTPSHTPSPPARSPYVWIALAAVGGALGFLLSTAATPLPGAEQLTVEDGVDLACLLLFGVLGAELLRRGTAQGLGRALLLLGTLEAVNYLLGGVADALTDGETPPSVAARLGWMLSGTAFIATFFLFVYAPLALFPTGRLPSPRWRWLTRAAVAGVVIASLSVLLAPGSVDEDNPATGSNPLGVGALDGLADVLEVISLGLLAVTVLGGLAAYLVRWVRYRGPRRRQLTWFTAGVVIMVTGMLTDITEFNGSEVAQVATALAIFGTLLVGMAWPLLGPLGRQVDDTEHTRYGDAAEVTRTGTS